MTVGPDFINLSARAGRPGVQQSSAVPRVTVPNSASASLCEQPAGEKIGVVPSLTKISPTMMKPVGLPTLLCGVVLASLSACGGGSSDSGSTSPTGSGASSTNGAACNYPDLVSASEKAQANACGIQVSAGYGAADSYLQAAIASCQAGQKANADFNYSSYQKSVKSAQATSALLSCGGANSPVLPAPTTPTTPPPTAPARTSYNFCAKTTASGGVLTWSGSCHGPVAQGEGGCANDGTAYVSQYSSQSACVSSGQSYLNSKSR